MPQDFFFGEDGEAGNVPADFATGPATGFLDNFREAYRSTRMAGRTDSRDLTLADAYEPVVESLNQGFRKAGGWTLVSPDRDRMFTNPYRGESNSPWVVGDRGIPFQEQRIWDEIARRRRSDPKFLAELGADRGAFVQQINARAKAQLERESEVGDRATTMGTIGGFAGALSGGFSDPVNLATLVLGGGPSRSILHTALREAGVNAATEAVTLPIIAQRREEIDVPMTAGEAVLSVTAAGVLGGVVGGGVEGFRRLGKEFQAGRVRTLSDEELLAATKDMPDPEIQAARDVVAENMEVDSRNPFEDTPSGQIRHREALEAATAQVLDDGFTGSEPLPPVTPSVQERLATFSDPAGPGQAEQIAALTHDIRAAMTAPRTDGPAGAAPAAGATPAPPIPRDRLINAVIGQESRGNPNAVSPKGARGRMQVMPGTNADPGFGVRPAADGSEAERARVGRDYLDAMMARYDGNVSMALAAYNAGPGRVDQWIKKIGDPRTGAISDAEWARRIPIKETREYVPSVLERAGVVADDMPAVALAEDVIDGQAVPVMRPLQELFDEHDADDAFIQAVEACLL
jgi:hypothetical protein